MKTSKNYAPCRNKDEEELIKVRKETKRSKVYVWKLSREINRAENPRGRKKPRYIVHTFICPLSLFHSVEKGRQKQVMENEFW